MIKVESKRRKESAKSKAKESEAQVQLKMNHTQDETTAQFFPQGHLPYAIKPGPITTL